MPTLFDGDNCGSDEELKINKDYAKNYDNWRHKEELNKLKTKYEIDTVNLHESTEESSSTSDSEDDIEENLELTKQFDKEFYKTLACLKKKDPVIYEEGQRFFNDNTTETIHEENINKSKQESKKKTTKEKALSLRDYERKIILEREGKYSDSEDEQAFESKEKTVSSLTYAEEERQLKESFKNALLDDDQDKDADLLKPKEKHNEEKEKEEEAYKLWLKGQEPEIDKNEKEALKPLRDFWTSPHLDENEKFLRDYILNNKYLDNGMQNTNLDSSNLIHDSDENLSEDERNIEKQEEFEHKYNFRFEEPDKEFIKRYPRTVENSLRKKDTRRAQKRSEVRKRKEEEKVRKQEELKQLKALKRKEIEEKIEKLKEVTGNNDIRFGDIDLEADFDPNEHDRKMREMFDEEYYANQEDDEKPNFPEVDEELGIESTWDEYDPTTDEFVPDDHDNYNGPHCEDPDFNMDADYDGSQNLESELVENTKKKKRRRRSKFGELIAKKKPVFNPQDYQDYQDYFDQYYSLDYEDMIGDLPCRFKYRKVLPNDYGLSVEEILMADDKELNKWCSLKRALQHKSEDAELNDVRAYRRKGGNEALKRKILKSLFTSQNEEESEDTANVSTAKEKSKGEKKKSDEQNLDSQLTNTIDKTNSQNKINKSTDLLKPNENENKVHAENTGVCNTDKNVTTTNSVEGNSKKKRKRKKKKQHDQVLNSEDNSYSPAKKAKISENGTEVKNESTMNSKKAKKRSTPEHSVHKHGKVIASKEQKSRKNHFRRPINEKDGITAQLSSINPERLKMYGINARKFKNKLKYGQKK